MVKCSTSLWSADLSDLAAEIRRVEPYSERFHIDVADGHHVDALVFFPDLVKALRRHTQRPFEVHLMTAEPMRWIDRFVDAGADAFIVSLHTASAALDVLRAIKSAGKAAGICLTLHDRIEDLEPYWSLLDIVGVLGTEIGVKGATMDASVPERIRQARAIVTRHRLDTIVQADGGIRRTTVPALAAAGVDFIVPGSLMFAEDPAEMRRWLATL